VFVSVGGNGRKEKKRNENKRKTVPLEKKTKVIGG